MQWKEDSGGHSPRISQSVILFGANLKFLVYLLGRVKLKKNVILIKINKS